MIFVYMIFVHYLNINKQKPIQTDDYNNDDDDDSVF